MNGNPPVSSIHGIFQARKLSALPRPPPRNFPDPEIHISYVSYIDWRVFTTRATWEAQYLCIKIYL